MKFKLSLILGAILSFPIHLFTFIYFVVPALKRREKWWLAIALLVSFLLVIGSLFISYSKIIPLMVSFLTTSGFVPTNVKVMLNFQSNISTILQFIIYTLLLFQLPILLEFLLALNIVSRKALWKASRYVILGTFILCAIVTPPDIISQVGLALPLIGLYFVTILIAKICGFGGR